LLVIGTCTLRGVISSVAEIILGLVFEILGDVLQLILELWIGDVSWNRSSSGILSSSAFWIIVNILLAGIIWWELR
jgi:hypothetical protein